MKKKIKKIAKKVAKKVSLPRTITLSDKGGNPAIVIADGHVGAKEFNRRFNREFKGDANAYSTYDIRYVYAKMRINQKKDVWEYLEPGTRGAKPFTVAMWD